jgi:hypothetical protein
MATVRTGVPALRARTRGRLPAPDHPSYEASRRTFNAMAKFVIGRSPESARESSVEPSRAALRFGIDP